MEEFRDIKGYEGKYQISNFGRVKSLKYGKERIRNVCKDRHGYLTINLYKEGKVKNFRVHRLVAEAFISNPNNYPCVNHKDENPTNNYVDNLERCTVKYNNTYGTAIQRRVANTDWKEVSRKRVENTDYRERTANTDYKKKVENTNYKLIAEKLSKTVLQFTKDNVFVREWSSTNECGRNGFDQSNVSACCRGELKSYKGFIWRYKNN